MASFKGSLSTDGVEHRYFKRVFVILESDEDVQIVKDRWFFDVGDAIEFNHANSNGEGGGANQVCNRVDELLSQSETSFGIVDRDAIRMTHPDLWWETDDGKFRSARPMGNNVRVLSRWEIENYLLDPEIIEESLADIEARPPRRGHTCTQTLYGYLDAAVALSAADVVANCHGLRFDHSLDECPEAHLTDQIAKELGEHVGELPAAAARIRAFGSGEQSPSLEHWERISRMIDGKRLLRRIKLMQKRLGGNDRRLDLASKLRTRNRIPQEFSEHVEEFKAAARR
ncbi:MAG: hypothetical protein Q8M11_08490 [Sulfuritalea sp.]|nr:hypothetical protein [Sulfuritalea sp.]MDP1984963.1 hypothetical protein [Sulfuritalea sp.]